MLQSRIKPLPTSTLLDTTTTTSSPEDQNEEDIDLFTSFLPHLFPDETHTCLGDPGQTLLYDSPVFGGLRVVVPGDDATNKEADGEEVRRLFAHYLWGGALIVAEGLEGYSRMGVKEGRGKGMWDVRGLRVLEVGAGEWYYFDFSSWLLCV